jgi:sarcosine oxidase, subunit delta
VLRILCPYCGRRDESEFTFGGPAHTQRPDCAMDDATWTAYLFDRENKAGLQFERWLHLYGCNRWFHVARDTVSHKILKTYLTHDPRPDFPDEP